MATQSKTQQQGNNASSGQSAGRKSNSTPKVQTFTKFSGMNIQLSPRDFQYDVPENWRNADDQTDLMMNYVVIQNNVDTAANGSFETRQNFFELFEAPSNKEFTDIVTLIGDELYIATNDNQIHYGSIGGDLSNTVDIQDIDGQPRDNTWTFLGYAEDQLVGMTKGLQLWTGAVGTHTIRNAKEIPTPPALTYSQLSARGTLTISQTLNDNHPFRITLSYTHLNKYGPTLASDSLTFYANKPTTEWSAGAFLNVTGTAPTGYDIVAVEMYYTEDEYQDPAFLTRIDLPANSSGNRDGGPWAFNWTGYLFDTSMWTVANLSVPIENYTAGVPASKMVQHDGRLYFYGGEPAYRLWIGGNPGNAFSVSIGVGGGFTDIEPGTGQEIRVVPKWKTTSGASIVTMLCDNINSSKENRHNLVETNLSLSSEQSTKSWKSEKVNGTVGCKSYYGAGVWAEGLYAVSRYGLALTTLQSEYNSQMRVQYVSDAIEPAFVEQYGTQLSEAVLLCVNDILYMSFGSPVGTLEHVIFCYDINLKAWWTYTLDIDEPILNMINIDHEQNQEGIGIITPKHIYLLPTTKLNSLDTQPTFESFIETGELSTSIPMKDKQRLTQIEFDFDYFYGDLQIDCIYYDFLGQKKTQTKLISHDTVQNNLAEYMRVDADVESYKLIFSGQANYRMTQWKSRCFPKPTGVGLHMGFDTSETYKEYGDIHPYFKSYNDIKKSIIP